ncbi:MAG: GAF domain-containing protein [Acholeplasma sp.]
MDYKVLLQSAEGLLSSEPTNLSILSNASAFLNDSIADLNWVGFYMFKDGILTLGPFQGKVACNLIMPGKGVVGSSYLKNEVIVIKNVHEIENHITCDPISMSETAIPIRNNGKVWAILDLDSPIVDRFDSALVDFLQQFGALIENYIDFSKALI